MLFSSPFFVFGFLPLFLILFFFSNHKIRDYVLLGGSISFYLWGEPIFCFIAIASSLFDHLLCKSIFLINKKNKITKSYLILGITANLMLLIYYKYSFFIIKNVIQWIPHLKNTPEFLNVILPIGISFITFEKITYLVDVYRGQGKPAKSLLKYLNYIFLFPKLLAGPIVKYHEIESQLHERLYSFEDIIEGFKRFLLGLIKKVLIADTCAEIVNQIFSIPANQLGFGYAWLGLFSFALQVYFDFSAYSDMALGLARMLGFRLKENFNMPYISTSFTEFWQRWHISLSTWIREYLYIPLGGNRINRKRSYFNLWVCFLLVGLWHGANWTFIVWGIYNGVFLIIDKLFWLNFSKRIPPIIASSLTFLFIILGFVIFRSTTFNQIHYYFMALLGLNNQPFVYIDVTSNVFMAVIIGSLLSFFPLFPGYTNISNNYLNWKWHLSINNTLFSFFGFFAVCKSISVSFNPFLYFKF
jgi:alginate O-acetyltransferase complex protein AlgI